MRVYTKGLMKAPYPFGLIGDGITRCMVMALPESKVRALLPAGLRLGEQGVTPKGTHPVILQFHRFEHCQFSVPTLLAPMRFREQTFGIPFTWISAECGPCYFMPRMNLDNLWCLMVGRNIWGFDKQMSVVAETENRYTVATLAGRRLVSLGWRSNGNEARPAVDGYAEFEPVREMLSQTLVSLSPAAVGPFPTLTDFDRRWNLATVRPLRGELEVDSSYLAGFERGSYSSADQPEGVAPSAIGCYELSAQWWLSYPYPAPLSMLGWRFNGDWLKGNWLGFQTARY